MTTSEIPAEPPLAGTETEHVVGTLERLRATFRWKADDLDAAGLLATVGASSLTLGGLLKHLASVEDHITTVRLHGSRIGEPWESIWAGDDDWALDSAGDDSPEQLYAFWDEAVSRARVRLAGALADGGLDQQAHLSDGEGHHVSLRRLLFDLIEEYGRHTGHADLIRESVDGRVGEDVPSGWRPVSGTVPTG